eukprot:gene2109-3056_t
MNHKECRDIQQKVDQLNLEVSVLSKSVRAEQSLRVKAENDVICWKNKAKGNENTCPKLGLALEGKKSAEKSAEKWKKCFLDTVKEKNSATHQHQTAMSAKELQIQEIMTCIKTKEDSLESREKQFMDMLNHAEGKARVLAGAIEEKDKSIQDLRTEMTDVYAQLEGYQQRLQSAEAQGTQDRTRASEEWSSMEERLAGSEAARRDAVDRLGQCQATLDGAQAAHQEERDRLWRECTDRSGRLERMEAELESGRAVQSAQARASVEAQ